MFFETAGLGVWFKPAESRRCAHLPFFRSADIFVQSRGSDLLIARKPCLDHGKPPSGIQCLCYVTADNGH